MKEKQWGDRGVKVSGVKDMHFFLCLFKLTKSDYLACGWRVRAGMNPGAEGRCLGLRQACESGWTSSSGSDCLRESERTWAECKERDEEGCVGAASEDPDLTRVRKHGSRLRVKADGLHLSLGVTRRSEAWYFGWWPCVQGLETN